jgi:O-methyltransferase involved in polyketide biosynthesis
LQIISLGAGYDTLFFNLIHKKKQKNLSVFEVDCTSVVKAKCEVMRKSDVFPHLFSAQNKSDIFFGDDTFGCDLTSCQSTYRLFACDIGEPIKLMKSLCIHGADTHLPTLLIAECVIVSGNPIYYDGVQYFLIV